MDTMILAAGRGARLRGVVAPFHKPLMVHEGKAMIVHILDAIHDSHNSHRTVVVVAPENAMPIARLLDEHEYRMDIRLVVQMTTGGPGEAFLLGADLVKTPRCMVLMADNTVEGDLIKRMSSSERSSSTQVEGITIATKILPEQEARSYTRVFKDHAPYFVEDPDLERSDPSQTLVPSGVQRVQVWCGPVIVPVKPLVEHLSKIVRNEHVGELKLGKYFGYVASGAYQIRTWDSKVRDLGTQVALL